MKKVKGKGNCFNKTAEYAIHNKDATDIKIVHGIIVGQGPIEGLEHGHAWLVKGDSVIDLENGITMEIKAYEKAARLKHKVTYSIKAALRLINSSGHLGPWDEYITKINKKAHEDCNLKY